MKSILISIKPKHCANILNGLKTKEIRKLFSKDYRGWIYIYCTKDKEKLVFARLQNGKKSFFCPKYNNEDNLNGKIVARFYCDNVEEIACEQLDNGVGKDTFFYTENIDDIRKYSCLDTQDLINYLGAKSNGEIVGKAIYITNLEIFDTPKELSEFRHCAEKKCPYSLPCHSGCHSLLRIKKAPQNIMYIETDDYEMNYGTNTKRYRNAN